MNAVAAQKMPESVICCILAREDGQEHTIANRTHGVYHVKHPNVGERYALSHIPCKKDYADVGEYDPAYTRRSGIEKRKEFFFDSDQIATDICKGINDNGPGEGSFFGVFVCKGDEPTSQELEAAEKRLYNYFMQTIAAADAQWSANPRHDLVSGIAKRAARYLKLKPEDHGWLVSYQKSVDCPMCGERIKPGVAICKGCGTILDEKKWASMNHIEELKQEPRRRRTPRQQEPVGA